MSRINPIGAILVCFLCANLLNVSSVPRSVNITLGPRTSPWTPITSRNRYGYHLPLAASESRSFSTSDHGGNNNYQGGVPMIKHRENGATVGLDIPDSNLRLLLDIDELAAKPSADAIKLKVIEREHNYGGNSNERMMNIKHERRTSPSSYARQQSASPTNTATGKPISLPSPSNGKQYKIGFIRASDIHSAINSGALPTGAQPFPVLPTPTAYVNGPSSNIVVSASSGGSLKYSQPISGDSPTINEVNNKVEVHKYPSNFVESPAPQLQAASLTASASASKTNTAPVRQQQEPSSKTSPSSSNGKTNPVSKTKSSNNNSKTNSQRKVPTTTTVAPVKSSVQQQVEQKPQQQEQQKQQQERKEPPKVPQKKVAQKGSNSKYDQQQQQQKFTPEDEQQKQAVQDVSDEQLDQEVDVLKSDDQGLDQSGEDNDDGFGDNVQIKDTSNEQQSTSARLRAGRSNGNSLDSENDSDDEDDFDLVRITPRSSFSGQENCNAVTSTFSGDSDSMTIKEFAARLGADAIFSMFPGMEDQMQNVVDFANAGYTLFLPSNEAVSRLPKTLINRLKSKPEELKKMIENHVSDEKQSLKNMKSNLVMNPRASNSRLRVTKLGSTSITVNGQRVTQMDQRGPMGGSVNVLDGVLYPAADKNVMDTLKSCNRFDGFVTLADGTGLGDTLSKGGPYTIFVPSNEALQKIPDNDLERIRNNMTALKEFLMYHVADGSYYSSDLRDGQFIPSLLSDQEIQVGVRVDGCSRRLVEANVSPLYRADIPASNGVIHVVDWILKPNDRDWCDGVILPRKR